MEILIDHDVRDVAEFMQHTIPPEKLLGVANRLGELATLLWGHYDAEDVRALRIIGSLPTDPRALNIPQPNETERRVAIESDPDQPCVDDGSAVVAAGL